MTQRDKWLKPARSCVARYSHFKSLVRNFGVELKDNQHVTFILPMPQSWSKKKCLELNEQPHLKTPDLDNLFKALADSIYSNDSGIWDVRMTKRWGYSGAIEIYDM